MAAEQRSERAIRTDIRNPLRFQGQYFDIETGLHYNRYGYYDPRVGRFIGKDPIGFEGGLNIYAYAPNPTEWIDPLGLARKCHSCTDKDKWREQERLKQERGCDELHGDYNQAMNSALAYTQITAKNSIPNPAKFIPEPYNGRRMPDENRGFRVEYDDKHKAHINALKGRRNKKTICFEASSKSVKNIIKRFNK